MTPRNAEAYNLLGYAELASPSQPAGVQQAVRDFRNSLALTPVNGGAHFGLGRAALQQHHAREAVSQLQQALRLRPDAARIEYLLNQAYMMAGMPQQAREAQKRFAAWQKISAEQRILRVRCLAFPNNPQYPRQLGLLVAREGGDPGEAIYYLRKARQLTPGDAVVAATLRRLQALRRIPGAPENRHADAIPFR